MYTIVDVFMDVFLLSEYARRFKLRKISACTKSPKVYTGIHCEGAVLFST